MIDKVFRMDLNHSPDIKWNQMISNDRTYIMSKYQYSNIFGNSPDMKCMFPS